MTREEILQTFSDINYAYNNSTKYDTLKSMLDELTEPCEDCQRIYKPIPYYDCISRQNAIDAMWEELDEDTAHKVRDILEVQPSVIPNQEPCEDCISRAEAQKRISIRLYESALNTVDYDCKTSDVFKDIAEKLSTCISEIPSVQPINQNIKALGKELRTFRGGIKDEKVLTGFNMAITLCNKHLADMRGTE